MHHLINHLLPARYIKKFWGLAGIYVTVLTTHSTRHTSTNKANNIGLSIEDTGKTAEGSNDCTFGNIKLSAQKKFGATIAQGHEHNHDVVLHCYTCNSYSIVLITSVMMENISEDLSILRKHCKD